MSLRQFGAQLTLNPEECNELEYQADSLDSSLDCTVCVDKRN